MLTRHEVLLRKGAYAVLRHVADADKYGRVPRSVLLGRRSRQKSRPDAGQELASLGTRTIDDRLRGLSSIESVKKGLGYGDYHITRDGRVDLSLLEMMDRHVPSDLDLVELEFGRRFALVREGSLPAFFGCLKELAPLRNMYAVLAFGGSFLERCCAKLEELRSVWPDLRTQMIIDRQSMLDTRQVSELAYSLGLDILVHAWVPVSFMIADGRNGRLAIQFFLTGEYEPGQTDVGVLVRSGPYIDQLMRAFLHFKASARIHRRNA